jgi:hypothetical protein
MPDQPPVNLWTKPVTSSQTDEKIKVTGLRVIFVLVSLGMLALWTYAVRGIHDYCYAMSGWSDGASKRGPDDWTPYLILWFVPVLLAVLIGLVVRPSMAQKKKPER